MITCGRKARTIATMSLRIESFGQCSYVSSMLLENPKSNARVKVLSSAIDSTSSQQFLVRIIPSD
jgi:hypothetical protein